MVVRRWADDGLVEVLDNPGDRMLEVADLLGLPVLSRARFDGLRGRFPWLVEQPGRVVAPVPGAGGPVFIAHVGGGHPPVAGKRSPTGAKLLARQWRCPEPGCALFGGGGGGRRVRRPGRGAIAAPAAQPPPTLRDGVPTCPRHGVRLGTPARARVPRCSPCASAALVRRGSCSPRSSRSWPVARPEQGGGIVLGQWLNDEARRWISRGHVRFELRVGEVIVTDVSTNGSGIRPAGSMAESDRIPLAPQQSRVLGDDRHGGAVPGGADRPGRGVAHRRPVHPHAR